jgi:hypothetical protein
MLYTLAMIQLLQTCIALCPLRHSPLPFALAFFLQLIMWFIVTPQVGHDFSSSTVAFYVIHNFWLLIFDGWFSDDFEEHIWRYHLILCHCFP